MNKTRKAYESLLLGLSAIQKHQPDLHNFIQDIKWDAYRIMEGQEGLRSDHERPEEYKHG